MKMKVETVKGQTENVKKEGGEVKQSAQNMKVQDAMKNTGEMKSEGMKLKDAGPPALPISCHSGRFCDPPQSSHSHY
jgi:hypothetical protein